jgi:hypothetical protein
MGLYQSNFRFEGALPDLDAVRAEAHRRLGGTYGIEALELEGQTVVARSMLDPFTHPVVCAILQEVGGRPVDICDGQPIASEVPAWAHKPIREMAWRDRMAIRYRWWAWLFGTMRPR